MDLRHDAIWDVDGDGDLDVQDVIKFITDMDQDGIPNAEDADMDGDGEPNAVENQRTQGSNALPYGMTPYLFPDRDRDGYADMLDWDGDGYPNWLENLQEGGG